MPAGWSRPRNTLFSRQISSTAARNALLAGAPILCDAEMVAHGVTRARLPAGNEVICTLRDPQTAEIAKEIGNTRSAAAMRLWGERLGGAVVAIGNAPTALFYLLEMLRDGAPKPAAIIGMPVGFVGAAESKEALAENSYGVPYAIVRGRHGRQRHDGGRRQRAGEAGPVNALAKGRLIGVGTGPGDPGAADAEGRARAGRGRRASRISPSAATTAMPATIVGAHFRDDVDRIAAALSGDHRNRQESQRLPVGRSPTSTRNPPARSPTHLEAGQHGRGAVRRRPAVLRLLHASACAAGAPLSDRGHSRRHRHVGLLVAGRPADRPGRRCAHRAAGHDERVRADAAACRYRRRRHHEGRPQPAEDPPRAGGDAACSTAPSMSSAAPWPTPLRCGSPTSRTTRRPISRSCWCRAGQARP